MQISTWLHGDFLIDPIVLRKSISTSLKPILESSNILKIVHGGANDVLALQRDFSIYLTGCIDTQIMYSLKEGGCSQVKFETLARQMRPDLKHLLKYEETLSEWRLRPGAGLRRAQEIYATNDVHILLRIFDQLRYEVI
jgi:ribonuclease D